MGLEILNQHIETVETSLAFPLRQQEDDAFAGKLHIALATLFEHGLNGEMIELLVVRGMMQEDADIDELNRDLSQRANSANLNNAVRSALNIL